MKKIILLSFFFSFLINGRAQVNADCIQAIPLCNTPSFTFFATSGPGAVVDFSTGTISNPSTNPNPPNSGCLHSGELNPQWLLLTIGNAGVLEFVFGAGNSQNPQVGCYDWAMWPYNLSTCANIFNNTLAPIRCNWNGTCSNGTGIASAAHYSVFGGNTADFEAPLTVNACQQFIICISNYSGVNTLVSFESLGTASLSCSPNCNPNYAICRGGNATIVPVNYSGLTNPTFSLQPGGTSNTTGSFVVTPTVTTNYTTYITGINALNAVQTITSISTVTVNEQPSAAPTLTQTTCTNTMNAVSLNISFSPGFSTPGYSVNWSPIPAPITNNSTVTFTGGIAPGLYNATITTANGCTTTTSFSINPLPDPSVITLNPSGSSHIITCANPQLTLTAMNPSYGYTWTNGPNAPMTGSVAVFSFSTLGNWTIYGVNPVSGCSSTLGFVVSQNFNAPSSTITPLLQNITCNLTSITTLTATSNLSVNVTHQFFAPQGGSYSDTNHIAMYTPGGIGTFTHCVVNNINGCSTCKTFTLSSSQGFPTYSVVSAQNFTLGCTTKSIATINIVNAATTPTPGGPVSYTLLGPPTTTATQSGTLSSNNTYTVNVPGTYTVITRDNTNFCETRVAISVLSNTFLPNVSAIVPRQILNCEVPNAIMYGQSSTNNVNFLWQFPGVPNSVPGNSLQVAVNPAATNQSLVANFTLNVTDNNNTCKNFSIIPIYQNIFPPKTLISHGGTGSLTCLTATVNLTNMSSTGIPTNTLFPSPFPVIGYLWQGPSPQEPEQLKTTYLASTTGIYTLTGKDLNNGCISTATILIGDFRTYPILNKPNAPPAFVYDCGAKDMKIGPTYNNPKGSYSYTWTAPPGRSISGQFKDSATVNSTGDYRVVVIDKANGCGSIAQVSVINGSLTADVEANPQKGYAPLLVTFYNNSTSSNPLTGVKNIISHWSFGNGKTALTDPSNLSPATTYFAPGTYTVTMFATKGTCLDTIQKTIQVEIPSQIEIPNVFTPNGDNVNDLFFIKSANLDQISCVIIDRWGHKVYEVTSDTGNIAWDGKNQIGKDVAEGTYFYVIKANGKDGSDFNKKGSVSLYR